MSRFDYHQPESLADAVGLAARFGAEASFLAGGTNLIVQIQRGRGLLPNPMSLTWGASRPGPPVQCSGCDRRISGPRVTFPDGRRPWTFHHPHCAAVWHVLGACR